MKQRLGRRTIDTKTYVRANERISAAGLQRKSADHNYLCAGNEHAEPCKRKMILQRHEEDDKRANSAPTIVNDLLLSPGRPLDPVTLFSMEALFNVDFSKVRIHDGKKAADSAKAVNAIAYTLGTNIAFGTGEYKPHTKKGRQLLAHELTHILHQQRFGDVSSHDSIIEVSPVNDALEAEADTNVKAASEGKPINTGELSTAQSLRLQRVSFWESVSRFFGGGTFSDEELLAYLNFLIVNNRIEDHYDSDNKAREVVRRSLQNDPRYELTVKQKVLLIQEMLEGYTGTDDERAILGLLGDCKPGEISFILGVIDREKLDKNFHGDEQEKLDRLLDAWSREMAGEGEAEGLPRTEMPGRREIEKIVVDQKPSQTVTIYWESGGKDEDICSTGKGIRCVDPAAGGGAACSESESRLPDTNWTPVGEHQVLKKENPHKRIPYWTEFNTARHIALHYYAPVDGTPLSHGCVRLNTEMARRIYENSHARGEKVNGKPARRGTKVIVQNLPRPICNYPPLLREWAKDFKTAEKDPEDGEPQDQRLIRETRDRLMGALGISQETLLRETIPRLKRETGGLATDVSPAERARTLAAVSPVAGEIPVTMPIPTEVLAKSGLDDLLAPFVTHLSRTRSFRQAERVVRTHGSRLWRRAVAAAKRQGGDDRALYWARLQMVRALKRWHTPWRPVEQRWRADDIREREQLVQIFEDASRGKKR